MKLQLALDFVNIDESKAILEEVHEAIDIIEIGTPFIMSEGLKAVSVIRGAYPDHTIVADLKIIDAGQYEAEEAFKAGADIVTVLGLADQSTIQAVMTASREYGKRVMADMIAVSDIESRAMSLDRLGIDLICAHTAFDSGGSCDPGGLATLARAVTNAKIAVAGGITATTVGQLSVFQPEIVIVGGAITSSPNRFQAATEIKQQIV